MSGTAFGYSYGKRSPAATAKSVWLHKFGLSEREKELKKGSGKFANNVSIAISLSFSIAAQSCGTDSASDISRATAAQSAVFIKSLCVTKDSSITENPLDNFFYEYAKEDLERRTKGSLLSCPDPNERKVTIQIVTDTKLRKNEFGRATCVLPDNTCDIMYLDIKTPGKIFESLSAAQKDGLLELAKKTKDENPEIPLKELLDKIQGEDASLVSITQNKAVEAFEVLIFHEFGHAFGMGHDEDKSNIMYAHQLLVHTEESNLEHFASLLIKHIKNATLSGISIDAVWN